MPRPGCQHAATSAASEVPPWSAPVASSRRRKSTRTPERRALSSAEHHESVAKSSTHLVLPASCLVPKHEATLQPDDRPEGSKAEDAQVEDQREHPRRVELGGGGTDQVA